MDYDALLQGRILSLIGVRLVPLVFYPFCLHGFKRLRYSAKARLGRHLPARYIGGLFEENTLSSLA